MAVEKKPAVRKPRADVHVKEVFHLRKTEVMPGLEYNDMKGHVAAWCATCVPGRHTAIKSSKKMKRKNEATRMEFWCNSCIKCHEKKGWRGFATCKNDTLRICTTEDSEHGKWDYKYGGRQNGLDSTAKALARQGLRHVSTTQKVAEFVYQHLPQGMDRPDDKNLKWFIQNYRQRTERRSRAPLPVGDV